MSGKKKFAAKKSVITNGSDKKISFVERIKNNVYGLSVGLFFLQSFLIYIAVEKFIDAEMWQVALWSICGFFALYASQKKSFAALILNLAVFFGVSLIPFWKSFFE